MTTPARSTPGPTVISSRCAVDRYCTAITRLTESLAAVVLYADALLDLRAYLLSYTNSTDFLALNSEAQALHSLISRLDYAMLFRGDRVTVRKFASEADYAVTVLDRFSRFRQGEAKAPRPVPPKDDFTLNHIEEGILDLVARLYSAPFAEVASFAERRSRFVDKRVAAVDKDLGFFLAYLDFIEPLKAAGLPFCLPSVSTSDKAIDVEASFDLVLAAKLVKERECVVANSFHLGGEERVIVVSGPNQGGKTTFARMYGQLHYLAGLGCPVPGIHAKLFLPDRVFTHFEREEDITNLRGKLEDELVRLHATCGTLTVTSAQRRSPLKVVGIGQSGPKPGSSGP